VFPGEMNKIDKSYTLLLIGVEGYSTPVGKRDLEPNTMLVTKSLPQDVTHLAFVPLAEEVARRPTAGSLALRESEASATKRVAWNGNYPHKDFLKHFVFNIKRLNYITYYNSAFLLLLVTFK